MLESMYPCAKLPQRLKEVLEPLELELSAIVR